MNILLDAYFDRNYGDDIFVKGITSLFPMHKFYAFLEFYPESIIKWANDIPNLFLLPESEIFFDKCFFDAYVCVGGDIFPDGADYTKRIQYIKTVKRIHGKVLFIGFSMFHSYSEKSTLDLCEMMNEADFIAPRDEDSVLILKKMLPDKTIESMADLAFSTELKNLDSNLTGSKTNRILGISVRRPENVDEKIYQSYVSEIRKTVSEFLNNEEAGIVRFFGLSDGIHSDRDVIEDIVKEPSEEFVIPKDRTDTVIYQGDTDSVKKSFAECSLVICTRYHAILTCIAGQIPFIPISYEVKTDHLFHEIEYEGTIYSYDNPEGIRESVALFGKQDNPNAFLCKKESIEKYVTKSEHLLPGINELLNSTGEKKDFTIQKEKHPDFDETEILYGEKTAKDVNKIKQERESIKEYTNVIKELNEKNAEYFKLIEEVNARNAEYFSLIEKLNGENATLRQELDTIKSDWRYKITHGSKK